MIIIRTERLYTVKKAAFDSLDDADLGPCQVGY
jgi:hypothetical protein